MDRARRGGSGALNPQSALAGLNSPPRGSLRSLRRSGRRWFGSRAVSACEPGQVRKEAALSDHRQAQREFPDRSRGRRSGDRQAESRRGVHGPLHRGSAAGRSATSGWRAPRVKPGGTFTGAVRVVRVEHVVVFDLACSPGRRRRRRRSCPTSRADDVRRARLQVQRQQRDRARGWAPHRAAAQADRAVVDERQQVVLDALLARQFAQFAVRAVVLRGRVGDERDEHERAAGHPPAPARGRPRARRVQPNTPAPQNTHRIAAVRKRVARVDRQPGDGERRRTRAPRARPRRRPASARRRSHSSDSTPPSAAPTSTGGRRISPIRRGMYSGTLAIPVMRSSVVAVWRVLVSDHSASPVIARSLSTHTSGAARRQQRQRAPARVARARALARRARRGAADDQIQPVQPGERPRLRAQQPGERQQREHRAPPARRGAARASTSTAPSTNSR